jgi:hypothetical protein
VSTPQKCQSSGDSKNEIADSHSLKETTPWPSTRQNVQEEDGLVVLHVQAGEEPL